MPFNRSFTQAYFEDIFPGQQGIPFRGLPKNIYESTIIDSTQANLIKANLKLDLEFLYYKALLSYVESIPAIVNKNYSWATIRLYYSVFYASKVYLACRDIAMFRAERRLFYIKAKAGENIKKCDDTTDHKATMLTLKKLFSSQDFLLSNSVDSMSTYEWMMSKREEVNYKDIEFHDPYAPDFWQEIEKDIRTSGIKLLVDKIVNDTGLLTFLADYAVLGIPTKRLVLTVKEMKMSGVTFSIDSKKKELIEKLSDCLSYETQKALVFWK